MRILAIIMSLMLAVLPCAGNAHADAIAQNDAAAYLRLNNDTEPEMLTAAYWLDRCEDADALLLTEAQIAEINALNSKLISVDDIEPFALSDIGDTLPGETVRSFILHNDMPEDPDALFLNGEPTSVEYWQKLLDNRAADAIEDAVSVRFGYSVCRSPLRKYTTDDFIGENTNDTYYNEASTSELLPFLPVAVIHESADGEWCYVITYGFGGWTRKESVAICPSREAWIARQAYSPYLTVTGRELRLAVYPDAPSLSGLLLPMGTRLPLVSVEDAPDAVHGRQTYGCYVAKLPVRQPDGSIGDELYPIPVSEDVCFGALPCTRANIIRQIFKFIGDRYGWAGDYYSTDCSGLVHEVLACFGLQLARTSGAQARTTEINFARSKKGCHSFSSKTRRKLFGLRRKSNII